MSEIAVTLSRICNVMLVVRFTRDLCNITGACWTANFDDPDGRHPSIFGAEHK
jgi:hypothetical protein